MKVGDLVKFVASTCDAIGNPGFGCILSDSNSEERHPLAEPNMVEVSWPKLGIVRFHFKEHLEVVSESR